ncbi:MAG TPA: S8 family serine peptidase, partial [Bacteroidia bacterium]|nr:S8 family serine peptidase [Bacteroidia bacterium]
MKNAFLSLCLLLIAQGLLAQQPSTGLYFVYFKDKDVRQSPIADFHPKALDRRAKSGIAFPMLEDYPVTPAYLQMVGDQVQDARHALRWLNALSVEATAEQVENVKRLPFVASVEPFEDLQVELAAEDGAMTTDKESDSLQYHRLFQHQRAAVGMPLIEQMGLSGKGLRIAVFDAGFSGVDTHPAFAHLREKGQIKATQNFVNGREHVYGFSGHGTAVLSCIGGLYEGQRIGAAVDAEFILARTEIGLREVRSEEDNWLAAMEWADRQGADIISSSLGYSKPRYVYADMTGQKTLVTRAAAMAARKGILVVNS